MAFRKYVKKAVRSAKKFVKKRYGFNKKSKHVKFGRIAKDVMMLKQMVNAEKKRYYITPQNQTVGDITTLAPLYTVFLGTAQAYTISPFSIGQVYATSATACVPGWSACDITPYPSQSNPFSGREGSSIKLHSSYMRFQVSQQTSLNAPMKIQGYIVQVKGMPITSSANLLTYVNNMFLTDPFVIGTGINSGSGIIDRSSDLDPDFRGQYSVLRKFNLNLPIDTYSGSTQVKEYKVGMKYGRGKGHHIRYNQNTNVCTNGQLIMILLPDIGNASGTTYTGNGSTSLPLTTSTTGANINFNIAHYYYDN